MLCSGWTPRVAGEAVTAPHSTQWPRARNTRIIEVGRSVRSPRCRASDEDAPDVSAGNRLGPLLKKKHAAVNQMLGELGTDTLQERLEEATQMPTQPSHRLAALVQEISMGNTAQPRPVLVLEMGRDSPTTTSAELTERAQHYVNCGAHALALQTCNEDGTTNLGDLFAVVRSVRVPVLQSDWFLHPIQVVDAKQAGAAGVLGVIANITGNSTPLLSSFTAAVGMDAPVEVVNELELHNMEKYQVPFFGINLAVGISLAIPGFRADIADALLGKMPFGVVTIVGIQSIEEGRLARQAGADCLLVKRVMLERVGVKGVRAMMRELEYACSGDD
ncbi:hypothetical protein WJX73_007889 [Symbiochloris irregularis]|uniref:indole-3-glycerol-phosphate synthase n=1 Tax=Symbiochloris irregularis TaxID=706552 RepID=A0AAW1PQI5_9CHLO